MKTLIKQLKMAFLLTLLLCSCNNKKANTISKNFGNENKDIVILSTNDVLGDLDDNLGYAKLKHYVDNIDKKENYITLVDTGNFSYGTEALEKTNGKAIIDIINAVGYDLIVPGTYEFSYGQEQFLENMRALGDKVVCCNIANPKTGKLYFSPYKIFKYGDTKIAYIGVTSPEALYYIEPETFLNNKNEQIISFFEDETGEALYNQIQKTIDNAKANGADKIVLLSHLGVENVNPIWASTTVIANTKYIDAVIDGHSMEIMDNGLMTNKIGTFVPIVQAGKNLKYVGVMNITKDGFAFPAVISDRSLKTEDSTVKKLVDKIKNN